MLGSSPAYFPMEQQHKLLAYSKSLLPNLDKYRCLVGCLIYLTTNMPDLCTHFITIHTKAMYRILGVRQWVFFDILSSLRAKGSISTHPCYNLQFTMILIGFFAQWHSVLYRKLGIKYPNYQKYITRISWFQYYIYMRIITLIY